MRKFLAYLIIVPLGLVFLVFAVANRHEVTVSFDPFNSSDRALGFTLPLFVVIIACVILGVLAGGSATWVRQRRWRRAARKHEADARDLRAQLADWRNNPMSRPQSANLPPAPAVSAYRRDKQGATL